LIGNRLIFEQNGVKNAVANKRIRMATTPKNKMRQAKANHHCYRTPGPLANKMCVEKIKICNLSAAKPKSDRQ